MTNQKIVLPFETGLLVSLLLRTTTDQMSLVAAMLVRSWRTSAEAVYAERTRINTYINTSQVQALEG